MKITDENPRTFWAAKQNKPGETLTIDLQTEQDVKAHSNQLYRLQIRHFRQQT
jgi:hypothetical protein